MSNSYCSYCDAETKSAVGATCSRCGNRTARAPTALSPRPSLSLNWVRKPEWACICGYRAPTQEQHCGSLMSPVIHRSAA